MESVQAVQKSFRYFPRESSAYLIGSSRTGPQKLRYIGDDTCHALWCSLFSANRELLSDETVTSTGEFLSQISADLLLSTHKKPMSNIIMLSNYLLHRENPAVSTFLQSLGPAQKHAYLNANPDAFLLIEKLLPDYLAGFTRDPETPEPKFPEDSDENLPTDDTEIQSAFERFVTCGRAKLVLAIIDLAAEKKIALDISKVDFPAALVPLVAPKLARTQPTTFASLDAVEYLRTAWRPLALAALSDGSFLASYATAEKVHKRTILGLCSVIGLISFDPDTLTKIATDAFLSSATPHRFCLTLTFLAVVLNSTKHSVTPDSLSQTLQHLSDNFEHLLPSLLTRLLSVIAQTTSPSAPFTQFASRLLAFCGVKTVASGWLHRVLLSFSATPGLVPVDYLIQISDILQSFLSSVMPSLYLTGLRLFAQAASSAPAERLIVGLRVPVDIIADRFVYMCAHPGVPAAQADAVTALLSRAALPNLHQQLFRHMPARFAVPPGSVGYRASVVLWPLVLPMLGKDGVAKKIWQHCEGFAACPFALDIGLKCMRLRLANAPARQRHGILMDAVRRWIERSRGNWSCRLYSSARAWVAVAAVIEAVKPVTAELTKAFPDLAGVLAKR